MGRAPFQVGVFPYRQAGEDWEYLILKRADADYWQCIAGGGEDEETHLQAAKREAFEEANIPPSSTYIQLNTMTTMPAYHFKAQAEWRSDLLVIPEYYFAVKADGLDIQLSHEHSDYCWTDFQNCTRLLKWDSNKTAIWELNARLTEDKDSP